MDCGKDKYSGTLSRVGVGPHAGYRFCGAVLGATYGNLDLSKGVKRVVVLGPSHHVYLNGAAVSGAEVLETPVGDLNVDVEVVRDLLGGTGRGGGGGDGGGGGGGGDGFFEELPRSDDEEEHSIEMHLPFLARALQRAGNKEVKVVPILVGSWGKTQHGRMGALLKSWLESKDTAILVSTDFCHWGKRFRYLGLDPTAGSPEEGTAWKGIQALDQQGMSAFASMHPDTFRKYLAATKNTICGRHALASLLEALHSLKTTPKAHWIAYAQSGRAETEDDSSVSYASAIITTS